MADSSAAGPPRQRISGEDWYARDLTGLHLSDVDLVDVDLTEAFGAGAVFDECTFATVRFNVAVLTDVAFVNCRFTRSSFFDAELTRCKLIGSVFDACSFALTRVEGGNWSFVGLGKADLTSAVLRGVNLREADLTGARCHGATLRDVDLSGALLTGADLSGADLRGSVLIGVDPLETDLRAAIVTIDQAVVVAQGLGLDVRVE